MCWIIVSFQLILWSFRLILHGTNSTISFLSNKSYQYHYPHTYEQILKCLQILVQHIKALLPGLKSRISNALVSVAKEHASYGEITESKVCLVIKFQNKNTCTFLYFNLYSLTHWYFSFGYFMFLLILDVDLLTWISISLPEFSIMVICYLMLLSKTN